jgi:hypothetical protein
MNDTPNQPARFDPDTTKARDLRAAEALEFIALRTAQIEFHLDDLRQRMMSMEGNLRAIRCQVTASPGP